MLEEIKHHELIRKKHRKTCKTLNHIEHLLIFPSTYTVCVSIFAFAFVVAVPTGITSSAIRLKICVITAGIKRYKSIAKVGFFPFKKNYFICFNESPLRMMQNAFYFILKAFFVLNIYEVLP